MAILYKSLRVGKNGKLFNLYKFRTMRDEPGELSTSQDDPRITKIGRFLRRYKLDELPQLVNILKGEMSFFGPRATLPEVINVLSEEDRKIILSVKPGLFDYASLWNCHEEKLLSGKKNPHQYFMTEIYPEIKRLQIKYIQEKSFLVNLKIIFKIVWRIIHK